MAEDPSEKRLDEGYDEVVFRKGTDQEHRLWIPASAQLPGESEPIDREADTQPINIVDEVLAPLAEGSLRRNKPKTDVIKLQKQRQREQRNWSNGESEDGESFFTRHHWRDPFFRLFLHRVGDWLSVTLFHLGIGLMLVPAWMRSASADYRTVFAVGGILFILWLVYLGIRKFFVWAKMSIRRRKLRLNEKKIANQEEAPPEKVRPLNPGEATDISILHGSISFLFTLGLPALLYTIWPEWWPHMFIIGACLVTLVVLREWYRWRDLTILVQRTARGFSITYGQPSNVLLWFIGTPIGAVPFLEETIEVEVFQSPADKLIFRRCGDVRIASKLEGENIQYLDSIPDVADLQEFLIRRPDEDNSRFDE